MSGVMRVQRWQVAGAIYVATVCVVASFALTRGDTYSYNLYLLLLGLTFPLGPLVSYALFVSFAVIAVLFNIPLVGADSPFDSTWAVALHVVAYSAAATANVCVARVLWLATRPRLVRCRLLHVRA